MSVQAPSIDTQVSIIGEHENRFRGRLTQAHVLRSEWIKLYSLRSTRYALLLTAVLTVGFGLIATAINAANWSTMSLTQKATFDPLNTSLLGARFGVLAIGVLGVLLISGEYSTGMIRSTMTAVPTRLPVLWAKLGIYGMVALVITIPSVLIAFFAGQAILSGQHIEISFSHSGVPVAVFGAALYLTLVGLFAMGLGAILRNTAAGIASFAAIMFVIPPLITILPSSVSDSITPYLPSNAGDAMMEIGHHANTLSPGAGLAVLMGWVVAAIVVSAVLLNRRDV